MKKLILSALAIVAFAGSASAQVKEVVVIKSSDKTYCDKKADEYINDQDGLTPREASKLRKAYYDGCIQGRSTTKTYERQPDTISRSPITA